MQNIHAELLTELAHSHIDDRVRRASQASVVGASRGPSRRRGGHRRPRPRPRTVA